MRNRAAGPDPGGAAARLELLVRALGMSKTEFCRGAGVSNSALSNWLAGRSFPSRVKAAKLRKAYGVTPDWIELGLDENLPRETRALLSAAAGGFRPPDVDLLAVIAACISTGPLTTNFDSVVRRTLGS